MTSINCNILLFFSLSSMLKKQNLKKVTILAINPQLIAISYWKFKLIEGGIFYRFESSNCIIWMVYFFYYLFPKLVFCLKNGSRSVLKCIKNMNILTLPRKNCFSLLTDSSFSFMLIKRKTTSRNTTNLLPETQVYLNLCNLVSRSTSSFFSIFWCR